jgi:hypothetical protein
MEREAFVFDAYSDIPKWAYLSALEFLDGPRRDGRDGNEEEGRGIHFSRAIRGSTTESRRLVALAPSQAYLDSKIIDERREIRNEVRFITEEEHAKEEKMEAEEEKQLRERMLNEQERQDAEIEAKERDGAFMAKEKELEEAFGIEDEPFRLKRPLVLSLDEDDMARMARMEAEDLSDSIFYYGRNCGLSTRELGKIQEEMIDAFNVRKLSSKKYVGGLPLMVHDVGFPYNRLRLNLDKGLASSETGSHIFHYENEVRTHGGLIEASLFFMPVYYDESILGNPKGEFASPIPSEDVQLDVTRLMEYVLSSGNHRNIPLMTLQTCVLLKIRLQSTNKMDKDTEVRSLFRLVAGGSKLEEKYDAVDSSGIEELGPMRVGTPERLDVVHEAATRLVFIPVFTGKRR